MSKWQGYIFNYENVHMSMSVFMLFTCVRVYTNKQIRLSRVLPTGYERVLGTLNYISKFSYFLLKWSVLCLKFLYRDGNIPIPKECERSPCHFGKTQNENLLIFHLLKRCLPVHFIYSHIVSNGQKIKHKCEYRQAINTTISSCAINRIGWTCNLSETSLFHYQGLVCCRPKFVSLSALLVSNTFFSFFPLPFLTSFPVRPSFLS